MMPDVPQLRIFLSSPGDVTDERNLARALIKEELPYTPPLRGRVSFDLVSWDDPAAQVAMLANETPQESVTRARTRPAECDITIVILWSRIGTPLPESIKKPNGERYLSGTEWEYVDAFESPSKPHVLVYWRTERAMFDADDPERDEKIRQREKVKSFFAQFRNSDGSLRGGVNEYATPADFKELLHKHLLDIVWQLLESRHARSGAGNNAPVERWTGSPYPGLRAFLKTEAPVFFGRGRETDALIAKLRDGRPGFVTVVGDSGTGKSSLVYAGVLPRLEAGALNPERRWVMVDCKPAYLGENPFLSLADALIHGLSHLSQYRANDLANQLEATPESIQAIVAPACGSSGDDANLLLFFDQLEELFTQCAESFREPFAKVLKAALSDPHCRMIATLRADFLAAATAIPTLEELLREATFPVGPLGPAVMVDVIRRPAAVAGLTVDDDLVDALLADVGADRSALPLVAFCLAQLYGPAAETRQLTLADYVRVGGLRGALAGHAEAVIQRVERQYGSAAIRELTSVFATLVSIDVSGRPTRQRAPRAALSRDGVASGLLDALIEGRLLSESAASSTVEVAHEALFECWPDLTRWIDGNRADLLAFAELSADAARWERIGRDESYLMRGARLQVATRLRDQYASQFAETAKAFLDASLNRVRDEEAASQKLSKFEEVRNAAVRKHVRPLLQQQIRQLANQKYQPLTEEAFNASRQLRELENLMDPVGRWHPESAQIFRESVAAMDYVPVWKFPCCGQTVWSSYEPSQFSADGCEASPITLSEEKEV
jgi:hypothetical protein